MSEEDSDRLDGTTNRLQESLGRIRDSFSQTEKSISETQATQSLFPAPGTDVAYDRLVEGR